jgi:hypothetical protein
LYDETGKIDLANRQIDPETGSLTLQAVFKNETGFCVPANM